MPTPITLLPLIMGTTVFSKLGLVIKFGPTGCADTTPDMKETATSKAVRLNFRLLKVKSVFIFFTVKGYDNILLNLPSDCYENRWGETNREEYPLV
jgi:hypothetical protein